MEHGRPVSLPAPCTENSCPLTVELYLFRRIFGMKTAFFLLGCMIICLKFKILRDLAKLCTCSTDVKMRKSSGKLNL